MRFLGVGQVNAQPDVETACVAAYRRARQVVVATLRYRTDIGERVRLHDLQRLRRLNWLA